MPQFPHLRNGDKNNQYLRELLQELKEKIHINQRAQCLTCSKKLKKVAIIINY